MINPWHLIDLEKYEKHMSSAEVYQLQTLNEITKEQLMDNNSNYVGILGAAGGNGLNVINIAKTKKVYAIDINKSYLETCKQRYEKMENILELLCMDLTKDDALLPYTDLLICNLIIEYIGEDKFVSLIDRNRTNINVVSCVVQNNNNSSFVSSSEISMHFEPISAIHHDVSEEKLKDMFMNIGFTCVRYKKYGLPNGKEFTRMDYKLG